MDVGVGGLEVYKVSLPQILKSVECPEKGSPTKAKTPGRLRENFMFRHWKSKVAILQEVPELLQRCDQCRMHMQGARLFKNQQSDKCHKSTERRLWRRDVEIAERCRKMEFNIDEEEEDKRV